MSGSIEYSDLEGQLERVGQTHVLRFWDQLDETQRMRLSKQLEGIEFEKLRELVSQKQQGTDWNELASRAVPPPAVRLDSTDSESSKREAAKLGAELLDAGKVGMILVAGGQGTRLGFDHPKGMFPIGPVSKRSLFQVIADQLRAKGKQYGVSIPLFVMTSPATHEETVAYLAEQQNLGLAPEDLKVFCQGTMPAVDAKTGDLLLAERDSLALSPDGHGGMLKAFVESECSEVCKARGIEHLFYAQIDNPLVNVCDEALLGYHLKSGSEMTTQVVKKAHALERVGNVVELDSKVQIIEYSDLPDEVAKKQDALGAPLLWAGNIAVHVFRFDFLNRMYGLADALPFHLAKKKVPFLGADGGLQKPDQPNAIKFERFIFDLLPQADSAIAVEAEKAESFAPVKNAPGNETDTAELAQQALVKLHVAWLNRCGVKVVDGVLVEINPLFALNEAELKQQELPDEISAPTYFGETGIQNVDA